LLSWKLDGGLLAAGACLGRSQPADPGSQSDGPDEGASIAPGFNWGLDRQIVGNRSGSANRASDWALVVSSAYPFALAGISAPEGKGFQAPLARLVPYLEGDGDQRKD